MLKTSQDSGKQAGQESLLEGRGRARMPVSVSEEAAGGSEERSTCRGAGGCQGQSLRDHSHRLLSDWGSLFLCAGCGGLVTLQLFTVAIGPSENWGCICLPPKIVLVLVSLRGSCWPGNSGLRGHL